MRIYLLSMILLAIGISLLTGTVLAEETLLAFYTLNQTAVDQTGYNGDANLVNTPFEDGGVYLNGNYVGTTSDSAMVKTPNIAGLDFSLLSVRVDFKISEWPSISRPILICGSAWRWMGAHLTTSGNIYLSFNATTGPGSIETVTPGVWHTLAMTYDGTTGHLLLDGTEVASKEFIPTHNNDSRFVSQDGGSGKAFKGHLRNLVVYNGVVPFVAAVEDDLTPAAVPALRNYPNPFNPVTTITFSLPNPTTASLGVFDLSGRSVQVMVSGEMLERGPHEFVWSGTDMSGRLMPSGTYIYRLEAGGLVETKRMTLLK